jgi:hypothetical protein
MMPWPSMAHWRTISPLLADSGPLTLMATGPRARQLPAAEILVALADRDAAVGFRSSRPCGVPARQIGRRGAQHPPVAGDAALDDIALMHVADADVELEALLHQIHRAVEQLHLDLQLRVAAGQPTGPGPGGCGRKPVLLQMRSSPLGAAFSREMASPIRSTSSRMRCAHWWTISPWAVSDTLRVVRWKSFSCTAASAGDALADHGLGNPSSRAVSAKLRLRATTQNRRRSSSWGFMFTIRVP